MSNLVYQGQKPGYLFKSIQTWLLLTLELLNACIATILAATLVNLRSNGSVNANKIGWAGVALVNTVSMGTDIMLLVNWWVRLEGSMGSYRRIMEYVGMAPMSVDEPAGDERNGEDGSGKVEARNLTLAHG